MSSEKRETKETERAGERDSERIWNMFTLILLASDVIVALHLVDPSIKFDMIPLTGIPFSPSQSKLAFTLQLYLLRTHSARFKLKTQDGLGSGSS